MPSRKVKIFCPSCGNSFYRAESDIERARRKSGIWKCKPCSLQDLKVHNQKPLGSRRKNCGGYIEIRTEQGWVFEHRYIYEQAVGRQLERSEAVHHLNGDITDNRLENIAVMAVGAHTQHHHRGSKRKEETRKRISKRLRGRTVPQKLNATEVKEIKNKYYSGEGSYSTIANQYNVSKGAIRDIVKNKVWRNVV